MANLTADELTLALTGGATSKAGAGGGDASGPAVLSAGDVATQALVNFPSSLAQMGKDVIKPFLEPVLTAKSLFELGKGVVQLAIPGEQGSEETARSVGKFFADRYGGIENIKRTIATDPAGFLADLALLATGGIGVATKAGKIAKVSEVATRAGEKAGKGAQLIDPIVAVISGAGKGGGKVLSSVFGVATGVGSKPIQVAFQAGRAGGEKAQAFLDNLRGKAPITDLVDSAREALNSLRKERRTAYLARMENLGKDQTPLSLDEVDKVVSEMSSAGAHTLPSGRKVSIRGKKPAKTLEEIQNIIDEFKGADAAEMLTAIDLDAMKQAIGEIRDQINIADNPTSWNLANQVYGSIRRTIIKQDKDYANTMKEYEQATDLITQIENTFNMKGTSGRVDSQVRKLTSIMRDSVNTAYAYRGQLGEKLAATPGGELLLEQAAGATLAPMRGRGLANISQAGILGAAIGTGNLALASLYPATMPRVVGEAARIAGVASRYPGAAVTGASRAAPVSFQAGRTSREAQSPTAAMLTRALQESSGPVVEQAVPARSRAKLVRAWEQKYGPFRGGR